MNKNFTPHLHSIFILLLSFLVFNSNAQIVTTFNNPANNGLPANTWVCPTGITSIQIEAWGGGGAGGGSSVKRTGGGGGGGGVYALNAAIAVTPGTTYTITVGAGGVGGSGIGPSGGPSIFGSFLSAFGGVGGSTPASGSAASGGAGATSGFGGTKYIAGGNGSNSTYFSTSVYSSGAGGGGAGSTTAGATASGITGGTGGSTGGGTGGAGYIPTAGNVSGLPGATLSAGGGGAIKDNNGGNRSGGNGANGQVRITYVAPPCTIPLAQPTALNLTPAATSIAGSFTASTSASGYLVVMTTTATAPSNPIDGTTYTAGSAALGGTIISANNTTSFNATGLTSATQYWFWVFAYQAPTACTGVITYLSASPLTGTGTTTLPTCIAPLAQPTALALTPYANVVSGSFTASATASGYLVVMTTTATAPTNPVNGTSYTVGANILGGKIISTGSTTSFNATSLSAGVQYWFWVFAYNNVTCSTAPAYLTASPLNGTATTLSCGLQTNVALINSTTGATYTGGTNTWTFNWSALNWSLGHLPTTCENVLVTLDRTAATVDENITINLDVNYSVRNFNMINISNTPYRIVFATTGNITNTINGNLVMECPGGSVSNSFNRCVFSNSLLTTITGDLVLGRISSLTAANEGHSAIGSNGSTPNQTYTMLGNMTFNPRGYTTDEWAVFNFDKAGTQYIYNNTRPLATDTIWPVLFEDLRIGSTNATTLIMRGTMFDGYIENVGRAGITIGVNSTLDLPANYSLNNIVGGTQSFLKMLAGSKLRLGGDRSINDIYGYVHGVPGSNFPKDLNNGSTFFDNTSTVEYYGDNTITQTIYNGVTYKNLIANNGVASDMAVPSFVGGTAHAQKITTGPLTVSTSFNIKGFADVTLGTLGSSALPVICNGPLNILTDGGLYCNANEVSGTGAFAMNNLSLLGMGHPLGISPIGTNTGNIQMTGGRIFNTTGNYLYNGIVTQITGTGLPASAVNDLTIDNPTTVTIANDQLVNGVNLLKQGTFDILANKITINGAGVMNAATGKMKADIGTVNMSGTSGTAQNLSGNWFVNKTINILTDANTTGIKVAPVPADTLLIAYALEYGIGTSGSTITTNDNLTLLSRLTKTANFGNATNNSIVGKVNVERYMFARSSWRLLATPIQIGTSPTVSQAWREGNSAFSSTGYGTRLTGPSVGGSSNAGILDDYSVRYSMKSYNSTNNTFTDMTNANTTAIANTKGYYVFIRGDRGNGAVLGLQGITNLRIKGDLRTGNQTFVVPANKFETIGNPYASRFDMRTVNKSNVANAFIVWNPNSAGAFNVGGFDTYIYNATSTNYERVGDNFVKNNIESGEAIFVQSNVASPSGSFTIKETDKGNGSLNVSRPGISLPTLDMLLFAQNADSSMYMTDALKVNFDNNYSAAIDNDDVRKSTNSYDNIGLLVAGNNLVVERRGNLVSSDTIRLNMSGMRITNYRIDIDPSVLNYPGLEATFVDNFLNTRTPVSLTDVTAINFTTTAAVASRAANRFMIVFKAVPSVNFISINAKRNTDKTIKVNWTVDNEINVANYTVENSADGINFAPIGTENATSNTGGIASYGNLHSTASENKNWYRIKANSAFGTPKYSAIALVNEIIKTPSLQTSSIAILQNVITNGQLNIALTNQALGNYNFVITNAIGQAIKQSEVMVNNNNFIYNFKTGIIAKGNYQLTIISETGEKTTLQFVVK